MLTINVLNSVEAAIELYLCHGVCRYRCIYAMVYVGTVVSMT